MRFKKKLNKTYQPNLKPNSTGRPTILTPELVKKLEAAAQYDCSIPEMAFSAGISKQDLYNWINKDKALFDRLEALRNTPVIKARTAVVQGIVNFETGIEYLKNKRSDEFNTKTTTELKGGLAVNKSALSIKDFQESLKKTNDKNKDKK